MTDEQQREKKKYSGEKKASMKRRDNHHDYRERRMYMITLEVEGRRPLFGRVVGNAFAERGSRDEPHIELTELGKAVQSEWMGIHGFFPQIEVMAVQMMPDHMHGILFVKEALPVHLGQVISGFKAGCRKAQRALLAAEKEKAEERAAAQPLLTEKGTKQEGKGMMVSPYVTALPLREEDEAYRVIFSKGYNDLILRSFDELPVWQNYLHDNPRRLLVKRARPEWLRPFFGLQIGSHSYSGIGNCLLLTACKRKAVLVSRRLSDSEIEEETARYLEMAKQGTVLVSAAISPGEKRVMRAVFDAGFPTIVIMQNGFTPLSKPQGRQFDACARGALLMLAPWEHQNEKQKITSAQCRQINLMALEICEN